jgi:hypothetical protein
MIGRFVLLALLAPFASPGQPASDLDQLMARVIARRDDNWKKLQQYILEERETAALLGPGGAPMFGLSREYTWYIRDGRFVRSPVRFDGVTLSEDERRKYEDDWLERERRRDARRQEKDGAAPAPPPAGAPLPAPDTTDTLQRLAAEPKFVSAAYFLKFRFEQGRYAFAGPDTYEGHQVLKIEYYPARLYSDDGKRPVDDEDRQTDERLNRQFNKVALVTIWVEPGSHQIVRYVFENIGMDFLPGRSFVRIDDVRATMEMGQPFPGIWLPRRIDGSGAATLANGTYQVRYAVDYHDYREATTRATIR